MKPGMTRPRGFTLAELLTALAIMAVLASVAYPGYAAYLVKARRLEGQAALIDAMRRQEHHRAFHHTYVAFSAAEPVAGMRWWSGERAAASAYEIDAEACADSALRDCVLLRARPGTARVDARHRDPECDVLTLDSRGEQGASGPGARCWP